MSTEIPPTEPTEPVASAPAPTSGPVKPDNQYNDIIAPNLVEGTAAPAAKKTATPSGVQPHNPYNDSAPKG